MRYTLCFASIVFLIISFQSSAQGHLWGVGYLGGDTNSGTIFKANADGSNVVRQFSFDYNNLQNGGYPIGGLVRAENGNFYGATIAGGANYEGVIYEWNPRTNSFSVKHDFDQTTGGFVYGAMTKLSTNSKLYGVTAYGGTANAGVIFEYDPLSNNYVVKTQLTSDLLSNVYYGGLAESNNGELYGTAYYSIGTGAIFSFGLLTGLTIIPFSAIGGSGYPLGGVVQAGNGKIYGTMASNGIDFTGSLFEFDPVTFAYRKFDFPSGGNMSYPIGSPVQHPNGKLYGTTYIGGNGNYGSLYEFDPINGTVTKKIDFDSVSTGANPFASLTLSPNNKLYGTAPNGGAYGHGVLFEYDPATGSFQNKFDFDGTNGSNSFGALIFVKEDQSITFNPIVTKTYGDQPFNLTANADSGLGVTYVSSDPTTASINGNIVTIHRAGEVTITAQQSGNSFYFSAPDVSRTLVINRANQVISFASISTKTYGDQPFDLTANADSGLAVTYISSDPSIATIYGSTVMLRKAGAVIITAQQVGNDNYNAAPDAPQQLLINKASQSISFPAIDDKTFGDQSFDLTATANSGLLVSYSSSDLSIATINGSAVTILKAGRITITAHQSGGENYLEAEDVNQSFCIDPSKPTFSHVPSNGEVTLTSSAVLGNQWYLNGEEISGAVNRTFVASEPGDYKVQITVDDCKSEFSESAPIIITGDVNLLEPVSLFPNPSDNSVYVKGVESNSEIFLFDSMGKQQFVQTARESQYLRIDVKQLSSGVYALHILSNGSPYTLRFVKQ